MDKTYIIPLQHQSGTYKFGELAANADNTLVLKYREFGDIIEYQHPDNGKYIVLYGIKKDCFEKSLKAVYNEKKS